jgi:hypothetical protein
VIEWEPVVSDEVVKTHLPLPSGVPDPNTILPSKNVTVPVASVPETVAVNVTAVPEDDGFGDVASAVEEDFRPVVFTRWNRAAELTAKLASPE